jgi:uncharacterized protein
MNKPEKRITDFIREHHVLTLATSDINIPWCAHCFYAYLEDENLLIFTSDEETRHVKEVRKNPEVAGSIVLETKTIGKIQGIQFRGIMEKPKGTLLKKSRAAYLKRFPYAVLMQTSLWIIQLKYIKMTDNRLGFGKKRIWQMP